MLEKLEAIVKQNKGGDGWLVGDHVSKALNNSSLAVLISTFHARSQLEN